MQKKIFMLTGILIFSVLMLGCVTDNINITCEDGEVPLDGKCITTFEYTQTDENYPILSEAAQEFTFLTGADIQITKTIITDLLTSGDSYNVTMTIEIENKTDSNLNYLEFIETIPKEVLESASMITSTDEFIIIEDDPKISISKRNIGPRNTWKFTINWRRKKNRAPIKDEDAKKGKTTGKKYTNSTFWGKPEHPTHPQQTPCTINSIAKDCGNDCEWTCEYASNSGSGSGTSMGATQQNINPRNVLNEYNLRPNNTAEDLSANNGTCMPTGSTEYYGTGMFVNEICCKSGETPVYYERRYGDYRDEVLGKSKKPYACCPNNKIVLEGTGLYEGYSLCCEEGETFVPSLKEQRDSFEYFGSAYLGPAWPYCGTPNNNKLCLPGDPSSEYDPDYEGCCEENGKYQTYQISPPHQIEKWDTKCCGSHMLTITNGKPDHTCCNDSPDGTHYKVLAGFASCCYGTGYLPAINVCCIASSGWGYNCYSRYEKCGNDSCVNKYPSWQSN
jgi:hypothetical protein